MTTVCFFLQTSGLGETDCSDFSSGNPGVGGTEYEFILVATELAQRYSHEFRVVILTPTVFKHAPAVTVRKVADSPDSVFQAAGSEQAEILVLDSKLPDYWFRDEGSGNSVKLVLWAHLDSNWRKYKKIAANHMVKRLVCVGREQLDLLRDHDVFRKATFIYNAVSFNRDSVRKAALSESERRHRVAFVGSLTPSKGFHILANAWPEVLSAVPDAELHVYGTGTLYDKYAKMGPRGLAEARFEALFSAPLIGSGNAMHSSVHFHGICVGEELRRELGRSKVGVINPNTDETFGLSAVDLQLAGCQLVVRQSPGVIDTCGFSPFSYANRKSLAKKIIAALRSSNMPTVESAVKSVQQRFSVDVILPKWHSLFQDVCNDIPVQHVQRLVHSMYRLKWLREFNRHLRSLMPFLPPIGRCQEILSIVFGKNRFCKTHSASTKQRGDIS